MNNNLSYRLYYLLDGAWRQRYLILAPTLLLPIFGLIIGLTAPKKFHSHTSMLIQETAKMNPFLEDLAVSTMLKERMSALQTLLHSRHILGEVAKERGLLNEDSNEAEKDQVINELSNSLSLQMEGKDLIRIGFTSNNSKGMQKTLESVTQQFIDQLLAPERSSMKDSAYFLFRHLEERREDLDKAEAILAEYKSQNAETLPGLHNSNISRLAQLRQQLNEREAEYAGLQKSLGSLDQQLSQTNPVLGRLEEQIIILRADLTMLQARYTEKHSKVQAVQRKLRRLEQERQNVLQQKLPGIEIQKLWDIASTSAPNENLFTGQPLLVSQISKLQQVRSRTEGLQEEISRLKEMISTLKNQTTLFGEQEQKMAKLERDLSVKRKLYEDLLERYEMARVTGSLGDFEQSKRIKIIDQPYTPSAPSNLPALFFVIGGIFGGIFLGSGLATIAELTNNSIRYRQQLEAIVDAPVLCRLPPHEMTDIEGVTL